MRILLINKWHIPNHSGAERAYFDLAKLLTDRGHEVAFFAMEHPRNAETVWKRFFVANVEYEGREYGWRDKLRIASRIIWNREANRKLAALIDEFRPDVAHCFNVYHQLSWSILHVLKRKRIPIVMTLCDYKIVSPNYSLFVRGKLWEYASGLRCLADRCVKDSYAKSLVCAVEMWVHRFLGTYRLIDAPLALSQSLIDTSRRLGFRREIMLLPQPLVPFPDLQAPLPPADGGYFLYYGRLSHEKGVATLLRAFANYHGPETLKIVGAGLDEERLKHIAFQELALAERVEFLGPRYGDELKPILGHALAVVIPSEWYENNPYVLLETVAAGVLVVVSDIGSLPERIQDGKTGFTFRTGDTSSLTAALARASATADRDRLREAAKKMLEDSRPEPYMDTLESMYLRVMAEKEGHKPN